MTKIVLNNGLKKGKTVLLCMAAVLLCVLSVCGAFVYKKDAEAVRKEYTDEQTGITLRYYIDTTIENSPATDVYIDGQEITQSITIPDSFTDEYGTHKVVSIGKSSVSGEDSFFVDSEIVTNKTMIDIDASNITSDLTINDYAFYRQGKIDQLILPDGNVTIGDKVLYGSSSSTIVANSPNILYKGTHDDIINIKAPNPSTTKDYIGDGVGFVSNGDTTTHKFTLSHTKTSNNEVRRDYLYVGTDYDIKDETTDNSHLAKMATLSYIPELTGHSFDGYFESTDKNKKGEGTQYIDKDGKLVTRSSTDSAKFTEDKTLYAGFTPCTYTLEYHNLTGAECDTSLVSYTYGNAVTLPTPVKTGYTFGGWYSAKDFAGSSYIGTAIKADQTGDLTLYAKWTANKYTIRYDKNNDNATGVMNEQSFSYDTKADLTANSITLAGYTFLGWNTQADGKGTSYADKTEISNLTTVNGVTITLYAQWKANEDTEYTVTYVYKALRGADEKVTETLKGTTDTTIKPSPENGARKGFITPDSKELTIKGDGTASVTYEYLRASYSVTVNKAEGINTIDGEGTYPYGTEVVIQSRPKDGYGCEGFSIRSGEGTIVENGCDEDTYTFLLGAENTVINAHAKAKTYSITYDTMGGTITGEKPTTYTHTQTVTLPKAEKNGYTLKGWYISTDPSTVYTQIPATMYGDRTFYAKWESMGYTIYLHAEGGTVSTVGYTYDEENDVYTNTHKYGSTNELPTKSWVQREGYTFGGWYVSKDCNNDDLRTEVEAECMEETHFYAKWIPMEWTITYDTNKGTLDGKETVSYKTGDTVKLPTKDNIYLKGFRFAGWYNNQFCDGEVVTEIKPTDAGNKMFFAKWSTDPYTITYNTMGGTINEEYVTGYYYNDKVIKLPTNVTKPGYSFVAWWDGTDIVKEITKKDYKDKTFTALWQSNSGTGVMEFDAEDDEVIHEERDVFILTNINTRYTGYYYTTLSAREKQIYGAFYNAYKLVPSKGKEQYMKSIYLASTNSFTKKEVNNAQVGFLKDHPEVFWVRYFKVGNVFKSENENICSVIPIPAYAETLYLADLEQYQSYFTRATKAIGIKNTDSIYQKMKKIYSYTMNTYSYDNVGVTLNEKTSNDTRAVGRFLVTKEGCCEAYAKLTKILCDYYSIPCILVSGSNHMWNQIKIGNAWYGYDVTSDDAGGGTLYFLEGKKIFQESGLIATNNFFVDTNGKAVTSYGCLPVPSLSSKSYAEVLSSESNGKTLPKKNAKYTVGNIKYVITKSSKTNGTVAVYGLKKKTVTSVGIPSAVKINGYTFKVSAVKKNAVKGLKKLKKVTIGSNVTSIGTAAFSSNKKLTKVTIKSKKLKTIGTKAFYGCKKLKKITLKTISLKKVGKKAFKGIHKKATIDVSKKYVKKYKKLFKRKGFVAGMKMK